MAFSQGQYITATELSNIGGSYYKQFSVDNAGYTYNTLAIGFYTHKKSGQNLINFWATRNAGCYQEVHLFKWDGSKSTWVDDKVTGSGELRAWWTSKGPGFYVFEMYGHNRTGYCRIYPGDNKCKQGSYLKMIGSPWYYTGSLGTAKTKALTIDPACHDVLTAVAINEGRCYTAEQN